MEDNQEESKANQQPGEVVQAATNGSQNAEQLQARTQEANGSAVPINLNFQTEPATLDQEHREPLTIDSKVDDIVSEPRHDEDIGRDENFNQDPAQKSLYSVTEGMATQEMGETVFNKGKMSRSQLEQRSVLHLQQDANNASQLESPDKIGAVSQINDEAEDVTSSEAVPGQATLRQQTFVSNFDAINLQNQSQPLGLKGSNQTVRQIAALGGRKISLGQNSSAFDSNELAITATVKDYSIRPEPKGSLSRSPTIKNSKTKTGQRTKQMKAVLNQIRDSASASVPQTTETVFMSNEKSPQDYVAHHQPRLQGVPAMTSASLQNGVHSNYNINQHTSSPIKPDRKAFVQRSDQNLNRKQEIYTAGSRGPNESSDLDQVHAKHFNQYLYEDGRTPDEQRSGKETLNRQGDSQYELISNSNNQIPIWPEKMKPLDVQTRNRPAQQFHTINHGDSLMETPKPDRMLNSIMYSEKERQNSVRLPGSAGPNQPKVSLRAMKAQAEHDQLIEEVRANHFKQVQQVVGPFLTNKVTSNTIEGTEDQMRKRIITNSYSIKSRQMRTISPNVLRQQAGGMAMRTQRPPRLQDKSIVGAEHQTALDESTNMSNLVSAPVHPKSQVRVPRDLLMMAIAKKQNELTIQNKDLMNQTARNNHNDSLLQSTHLDRSILPNQSPLILPALPGSQSTRNGQSISINLPGTQLDDFTNKRKQSYLEMMESSKGMNQTRNSVIYQKHGEQKGQHHHLASDFQSIQPKHKQLGSQDFLYQDLSIFAGAQANASTVDASGENQLMTATDEMNKTAKSQNFGQALSFHITDLLEQSIAMPRESNNIKATIDFYKRSVKHQSELNMKKEIIIKNYRLRVVDAKVDLTEKDRRIMKLNKGTSIYVANSLIKPEIYRYSTKVTNLISEIFPFMQEEGFHHPLVLSANDMESLTYEDQIDAENVLFEKYGSKADFHKPGMEAIQEEEEIQRSLEQRVINMASDQQAMSPPMSAAMYARKSNKILVHQEESKRSLAENTDQGAANEQEFPPVDGSIIPQAMRRSQATRRSQHTRESYDRGHAARNVSSIDSYVSPKSLQTQLTQHFEQDELRAVQQTDHLFEKWVRNIKTAYTDPIPNRHNPINSFGVELPPPPKDINYKLMQQEGKDVVLKEKPLPVERLTAVTLTTDRPYLHLMLSVTNPEIRSFTQDFLYKTTKYQEQKPNVPSHFLTAIQEMNAATARRSIKFMREQFTHLDTQIIQDGNLHPDLFINEIYVTQLVEAIKAREADETKEPIRAVIDYRFAGKPKERLPVEVKAYDELHSAFLCVNEEKNVNMMLPRIYIELDDGEVDNELKDLMAITVKQRAESFQYLRVARLIQNELLKRYGHLCLTEETREKIYSRIGLDLNRNRRRTVMKVVLQVEALYVFSVLRSTLSSQRDDPFIKNMLLNFKVASDSPALEIEKQRHKEKKDLQGIKSFKMSAVKQDLDKNSGFLTNESFIKLPGLNKKLVEDAVGSSKLFQAPFDVFALIANNEKHYKDATIEVLKKEINEYPLMHSDWVQAQSLIAKHFQNLVKDKWASLLAHSVWETLQREFDFTISKPMTEDDLDPTIYKVFNQIKQFQQNLIYRAFEQGLKDYLRFLLGFAMRNEDINNSDILYTIAHQRDINLVDLNKSEVREVPLGKMTNDLRLIPRQWGPMINLEFVLIEQGKSKFKKKMKIQSRPEYEEIAKDMFNVVVSMHNSLKGIKRVESIVFPLLELKHEFLQRPEFAHNAVLMNITKMIQKLLSECTKHVKSTLKSCNKYVDEIFSKKLETIILDLKKQSFALENQGDEASEAGEGAKTGEAKTESAPNTADGQAALPPSSAEPKAEEQKAQVTIEDDDTEESDSGDEEGGGAYQQNNMAFKSVDIDQNLMRTQIQTIRNHKWTTLENIRDKYDFGLLTLNCMPLKKDIIDHCDSLLTHLEKYIKDEFLEKMKKVDSEISQVKGRLDEDARSIDQVISLLEYIDTLKRTDNKVAEIQEYIDGMQKNMIFIDSVQIMFADDDYQQFLNIRNWPRSFNKWIQVRKDELLDQKNKLIQEMKEETNQVFQKMLDFKKQIKQVLKQGLLKLTVEEREERVVAIDKLFQGLGPENTAKPNSHESDRKKKKEKVVAVQYEIPIHICFEWLAQESGWTKKKFDSDLIDKTFNQTEELKTTFDDVSMDTIKINKREALLGVPKTSFAELKKIQDDLKPLYELWAVASRYNNTIPTWLEGQFEGIESGDLEQTVEDWLIELKRLQKTHLLENNKRQAELLTFMSETLGYFKQYYPMIKTLRSKGLALRHWRTIGQQLGFSIDPANVSLFKILALGLQEPDKLTIIKNISDIAQKEYAVMQALDNLDKEMKHVEFEFETAPNNETKLCKAIPDINSLFEEFHLRVNVLRTNPHMKNFFEKLYEIEKTVKSVIEILVDFAILQRNWLYLNGIFSRSEINKQLANEVKQFNNLDLVFKYTMKGIGAAPQVYKISHRDNFVNQLKKLNQDADNIKQGLAIFLEQKRAYFPRLYFISNEELIDVFGRADDVVTDLINGKPLAFLQNLFEGVEILKVNPSSRKIYAMCSKSGEQVPLITEIATAGVSPEVWLKNFEAVMQNSLRNEIFWTYYEMDQDLVKVPETHRDYSKFTATKASHERKVRGSFLRKWLKEWPSQCTYLAQQIWFTKKLVSIFESAIDRKVKVAKDKKLKLLRMDSDDEFSDNSDEYASVNLSDDEGANPTTKQAILEAQQKIVEAGEAGEGEEKEEEEEEDEEGGTQSNFNKTSGKQLFLNEENEARFILTLEDRIMRNRDRYLVNPLKHPGYQIEDVKKTVIQKTLILSQMLKKKLAFSVRTTVITFITILVYHRDYAANLKRNRIFKVTDFGWQLYMKFDLHDIDKVISGVTARSSPDLDIEKLKKSFETTQSEVNFEVLQYNQEFGYEYLGNQQRLVITPLTERCQRSLLVALQYNYGGAPEGPFGTGKTETTKDLGRHLGKQCYVQNSTGQIEYENILRFFKGIASAGAWLIFDEFNRLDPKILAFLSQIIIQIQNSIRKRVSFVHFDQDKNPLKFTAAVFITLNPGYAGRTELPMDLKNLFRSVSMVVPDAVFISEILLFSSGFKNAQELSKRICSVQSLANVLMQQASVVKFDFGLRAIKAIVSIAEQLKQQVQNIWESDLPDIVNEDAMGGVRWKGEHLIKDVQDEVDPSPEAFIEQQEVKRTDRSPTTKRKDWAEASNMASGELQTSGMESVFSQEEFSSDMSSIEEKEGSADGSQQEEQAQEERGINESEESDDGMNEEPEKQKRLQGPLFKQIFANDKGWKKRQTEIIMKQIGLKANQRVTEVELEEYIIVKAVKDYNTSKFSHDMLNSINGIISDVFLGSVPKLQPEGSNYSNLTELVFASFQEHKLDYNRKMNEKAFQMYEIVQVKQGCIILGDTQSGKSTLQTILETALNKAMGNELKIRISQCRKKKLKDIAIKFLEEQKAEEENPKQAKGKKTKKKTGDDNDLDMDDTGIETKKKTDKKKGKKNAAKSKNQLWSDLYKKSKLDKEEIEGLKEDLVQRGVQTVRINPKSLKLKELFGEVNRETYVWSEGQFTEHFRRFSLDKSSAKKWIQMDGPIDHYWVENLNSILDENRKMNLPNGETIQLSDGMCLLLETDSLANCTPATISRCGLVFLARADVNKPKQIFNQYLQRLPPNMADVVKDIENQTNWLMPECMRIFDNQKHRQALLMPGIDYHWLIQNYVKLLDSFFSGYWNDFIKQNASASEDGTPNPLLLKVGQAYGVRRQDIMPEDEENFEGMAIMAQFLELRLDATTGDNFTGVGKRSDARLAHNDFYNQESRYENSLKYLPIWSEAFVITSLVWTFAPVFNKAARKQLGDALKERILGAKSDFGTYQKVKKKNAAQNVANDDKMVGKPAQKLPQAQMERRNTVTNSQMMSRFGQNNRLIRQLTRKLSKDGFQQKTAAGFTSEFDEKVEKPMFISDYPFEQNLTVFDCYFNLDTNSWAKFDIQKDLTRMQISYNEMLPQQRLIQNVTIPTPDSIRYNYIMELLLTTQKPVLVFGEGASGKSGLIKDMIFNQMLQFAQKYYVEHITCSHYTDVATIKHNIERSLAVKRREVAETDAKDEMGNTMNSVQMEVLTDTGHLKPEGDQHKLIVFLEDMHMAQMDKYNDLPGLEVLRDLLTTREWYSASHKSHRVIDDTNLISCINIQAEQILRTPPRLLFRFALIGMPGFDEVSSVHIMTQLFEIQSQDWPSQITTLIPRLANAINSLFQLCFQNMKPTPLKVHYAFNYRECFKFVTAFCKVEGNYLKNEASLVKLFYHECIRQYADKIIMRHDLKWFKDSLVKLVWDSFDLMPNKELEAKTTTNEEGAPVDGEQQEEVKLPQSSDRQADTANLPNVSHLASQPTIDGQPPLTVPGSSKTNNNDAYKRVWPIEDEDNLWFSIMNMDVDGYYCEIKPPEGRLDEPIEKLIHEKIEGYLSKYNEQPDKAKISLTLFREFNRHLLKIVRAVTVHNGHVIIVGMKGYGINMMTRLACFAAGIQYNKMELHPNFVDDEWRSDLRKNIIYAASEDKQMAYVCDEYRILQDSWYKDLETLVKSNVCSEITRQHDILAALVSIQTQLKKSQNALSGGKKGQEDSKTADVPVDELAFLKDMRNVIKTDAGVRNKLYNNFLQKVSKNFHLIFNFTPSGQNFREKMDKHKQLMINSQMIFIQNLQLDDLSQIGQKIFVERYNEEIDKRPRDPKTPEQEDLYNKDKEKAINPKILSAVCLMYQATNTMAKRYHEEHAHILYFTPVFFIRTFRTFTRLLEERKLNVVEIQNRYNKGLEKLKVTMKEVKYYSSKLREKTPVMQEKQRQLVEVVVDIEEQYQKIRLQKERLMNEENECNAAVQEALMLKEEAQEALDKIVPCIKEALSSMQQIQKYDVSQVKTLDHPPRTLKLVMKAICILLDVEPIVKKNTKGVYKPSYWKAAIGPDVLGNTRLPEILVTYDKSRLTTEMMTQVEDILSEADYTYENAHKAFQAAAGLFRWVKAIRDYFYIFQDMQPRRDALALAEKQHEERNKDLKAKQKEIKELQHNLDGLEAHQKDKQKLIDDLKEKIDSTILRKRRADTLMKGLNAEQQKWVVCTRMLNSKYDTVQGDVLLAAGYITMAGGFTQKYRLDLVTEWQKCLKKSELQYSEIFGFQELFGDNFKIREWHANQLPPDTFSTDNGLILNKTRRYRMIIDPQQLAWNWIRKQYAGQGIISTKQNDPGFRRTLEIAIDLGKIVLIENLNEKVDVAIESLVRREITKYGNQKMLKFCRRPLKYDPGFDLFILTNLAKPHYDCNITNHVCQVNFYVTVEGLTQNLLSMIVANERPDLEESFNENSKATFENVRLLKDTENKILKNLSPNVKDLLNNDKLIEVLKESKVCAETVAEKLKKINNTNQFLNKTRLMYAPVAVRAANLYFAVTELYQVNKMYQFSMKWFFNVFNQTLAKANALNSNKEITIEDEDFKLLNHKFSADERISLLIKSFTQELIRKTIFSCFQDDRQLVTYFISIKVLLAEELLDNELLIFSMTGSKKIRQDVISPGPSIGIHWMNDVIWAELDALSNIKPFNKDNLQGHIKENPAVWNQLFDHKHVAFADLPNRNQIDLSDFFDQEPQLPSTGTKKQKTIKGSKRVQSVMQSKETSKDDAEVQKKTAKLHLPPPIKPQSKQQMSQGQIIKDPHFQDTGKVHKSQTNIGNLLDNESLKSVTEHEQQITKKDLNEDSENNDQIVDRNTESRASSKRDQTDEKIWTADEILADSDLWQVTESSEDEESEEEIKDAAASSQQKKSTFTKDPKSPTAVASGDGAAGSLKKVGQLSPEQQASPPKVSKYNAYERNKDYYEDEQALEDEQEQMARYLVDKAPGQNQLNFKDRFNDMQRKTKTERKAIMLREFIVKCQCELAMQRCVRPDLMQQALHKIVGTVYDFNYMSFELDVLAKFIDPDGTLAWRRHKMSQGLQTGRFDGTGKNNAQVYLAPAKKSAENNIQLLIKEAYEESIPSSPIYFLVTHSINVFNELQLFYQKRIQGYSTTKLHHFQVGKGLNKTIEEAIAKAAAAGDWVLIENLQLADEWVDELELIIAKLPEEISSQKFRLFLSSVQMDNCPHMILKQSVKVALQQPTGIKLKMERFTEEFQKDQTWRRGPNYVMHKNMYFALSYLHSVLDGRKMYGPLGWNIYSGFDASDFSISEQQLISYLGQSVQDKETQVRMLKYLYANVNFSGKISREEDLRKLNAIIEDLIDPTLAQCVRALPDMNKGHYGFPRYDDEFIEWVEKQLPKQDPCEVYGFNRNSERYVLKVRSFDIMRRLYHLNRALVAKKAMGYQDLQFDLENQSIRISLAKSSLHTQSAQNALLANIGDRWPGLYQDNSMSLLGENQNQSKAQLQKSTHSASQYFNQDAIEDQSADALLPLFVKMQKLLRHSSLDQDIKTDCDRFDEKIDQKELPMRDEYDKKVSATARQLRKVLQNMISPRTVELKLPFSHVNAVNNVFAIECRQFMALVGAMESDVLNLIEHIDGKYMKPLEIEKLWSQIQGNIIPSSWRKFAFQTAYVTLADFCIELVEKVKFWQHLLRVNTQVPAVWVPAFFDPSQFLNALRQKKSRAENIPARMIKNTYHILDFSDPTAENCLAIPNTAYVYGLWLEGASWDRENRIIVEQSNSAIYDKFPVIKVVTELMTQKELDALDGTLSDFEDNPALSKKDIMEKEENDLKIKEQMEREDKIRSQLRNEGKSKAQVDKEKKGGDNMSRMNSRMSSKQSLHGGLGGGGSQSGRDSQYNFKRAESRASRDDDDDKMSRKSSRSKMSMSRRSSHHGSQQDNDGGSSSPRKIGSKKSKHVMIKPPSGLSDLAKKEFAEDSREDEESSDLSLDEEKQARKWQENLYYYKCPVFRTTLRLRTGEISSDNKPVFYIKLPSLTHPRKWVKRSVALLMETYR